MKKNLLFTATLIFLSHSSFATLENEVQTTISGNGYTLKLPRDGSACDPAVISANLQKLKSANVLVVSNLTQTIPSHGNCYGACPSDLKDALVVHCQKAEKLAEIVDLLK